jgi:hypothetical protein
MATAFNRHAGLRTISEIFIENNLKTYCSAGCNYGCEVLDFLFHLENKGYDISKVTTDGCDSDEKIMRELNSSPYKVRVARGKDVLGYTTTDRKARKDLEYPYPLINEDKKQDIHYRHYFTED